MDEEVFLPRLTHDMQSGRLVRWLKQEGDSVLKGEALFEVETDKAVSEVTAEASGRLQSVDYKEGQDVPVGARMALIVKEGEAPPVTPVGKTFISPIAKRLARDHKVDLALVKGSGPGGRVVEADVRQYLSRQEQTGSTKAVSTPAEVEYEVVTLSPIQRITGQRMLQSSQTIPQFTLEVDVDMNEAVRLRQQLNPEAKNPVSFTALLVKAVALALRQFPRINATFNDDNLHCYKRVNIGVAMAAKDDLIVPVVHQADMLTLEQIQERLDGLKREASQGSLDAGKLNGGTFTLSNLGMYGIDRFTALINPPQVAILAVGRVCDQVWVEGERQVIRPVLTLRLSVDHRALDGATASPFLVEMRKMIENPYRLLR
jgi:pyruvate dehydrogenase E2 component (dihydrolipoamide acetyltransferase)